MKEDDFIITIEYFYPSAVINLAGNKILEIIMQLL